METKDQQKLQKLKGVVVSAKMKDTIVVRVDRYVKHKKYEKFLTKSAKFKVHDPGNTKAEGDKVVIVASKPFSKDKRFKLVG